MPVRFLLSMLLSATLLYAEVARSAESGAATPVVTARVSAGPVEERIPITGTVTSARAAMLSVAVAGNVDTVAVDRGSRVEQGDVLLTLDPELQQALQQSSRAELREGEASLADARRRLEEARTLETGIAASEVRTLEAEVTMAEAAVARLEALAGQQAALLRRHTLEAPFAGVISEKLTEAGEWVNPGDAVLGLVDTTNLRIDFSVPQEYYRRLDGDAGIEVEHGEDHLRIRPQTIVPVNDPTARSFLLRSEPLDADAFIPGMSVRGRLVLPGAGDRLRVPGDALVRYPDGRVSVWIAEDDDSGVMIARERFVRVASGLGAEVVVRDGVERGERVVVRGNEVLSDGQVLREVR